MRIIETTADEIMMASAAVDAVAVYLRSENLIYVQEGTDFTKGTDGYIVLTHELTHAARSTNFVNEAGDTVQTSFSETYDFGMYIEEAMLMRCAYALQGYEVPNRFYVRVSNYYRMMLDCIDYDGADFMNHGINYLAKVLDDYMGEEGFGRKVIMIQCAEAALHYESYRDIPFTEADFDEMHADMVRIYMKKYLTSEMSLAEAETVFQNFMELMLMNFRPDETQLEESDFRPAFENCCKELGIVE